MPSDGGGASRITPDMRLATYGTLAPGRVNAHRLAALRGSWREGVVHVRLVDAGWGAEFGYPGIILDTSADGMAVQVLESPDLPEFWAELDGFEGEGYRRVVAPVRRRRDPSLDICDPVIDRRPDGGRGKPPVMRK